MATWNPIRASIRHRAWHEGSVRVVGSRGGLRYWTCAKIIATTPDHERPYLVVPCLRSSRIHTLDTKPEIKNPKS